MKKREKKVAISFHNETYEMIRDYAILLSISEGDLIRNVLESFTLSLRYPVQERNADNARFLIQSEFAAKTQVLLEEIFRRLVPENEISGKIEELNRKANKKFEEAISQLQKLSEPKEKELEEQTFTGSSPKVAVNFLPEKWNSSIIRRPTGGKAF